VSRTALIVVDMLNTYEFEDADRLAPSVEAALPAMRRLIDRAHDGDTPVIYVNDNFGAWRSNSDELVQTALHGRYPHLVEPVVPEEHALFVVKARHSIFYQTPLEYLLNQEDVGRIVLVGQVTEQCILYSALDAHVRHFDVAVPRDAVAHIHEDLAEASLRMMELNMDAEVCEADACRLEAGAARA
jgi:nicotinamidase-related amidase